MKIVLAIDLGTTGNRVIAFSKEGKIVAKSYYEFPQIFPKPGWVEHNPFDIWNTTKKALKDVISLVGIDNVISIGITNQRETAILWNKKQENLFIMLLSGSAGEQKQYANNYLTIPLL